MVAAGLSSPRQPNGPSDRVDFCRRAVRLTLAMNVGCRIPRPCPGVKPGILAPVLALFPSFPANRHFDGGTVVVAVTSGRRSRSHRGEKPGDRDRGSLGLSGSHRPSYTVGPGGTAVADTGVVSMMARNRGDAFLALGCWIARVCWSRPIGHARKGRVTRQTTRVSLSA